MVLYNWMKVSPCNVLERAITEATINRNPLSRSEVVVFFTVTSAFVLHHAKQEVMSLDTVVEMRALRV